MKRLLPVLVSCFARLAAAQVAPAMHTGELPYQPRHVSVRNDGRCIDVRPGDTVHYTLTVEGVTGVQAIYGDLRLRSGHSHGTVSGGLPLPDFRSLGGGGLGTHDAAEGNTYHFEFGIPREIFGGTYRGVEVAVRSDQPLPAVAQPARYLEEQGSKRDRSPKIHVTRQTRGQVRAYCLNVFSNFGVENAPAVAVTGFRAGLVDPPQAPPTSAQPAPFPLRQSNQPAQPLPVPPQPR